VLQIAAMHQSFNPYESRNGRPFKKQQLLFHPNMSFKSMTLEKDSCEEQHQIKQLVELSRPKEQQYSTYE